MDAAHLHVTHDAAHQRFTVELDGNTAELAYEQQDAVLTVTHTRVPGAIGGRGVAAPWWRRHWVSQVRRG